MIIFFGEGGLGNQIYQYAFIKNFSKNGELIVTCNFKKFTELFEYEDRIFNIYNRYIRFILRTVCSSILKFCSYTRLISSVRAERFTRKNISVEGNKYIFSKGVLPITYIYKGYFQSESMFKKESVNSLRIKKEYLDKANKFLANIPKDKKHIFVHIRRGDYRNEAALGIKDITLPSKYYLDSLKEANKKFGSIFYIFMSNDPKFVKRRFKDVKNKVLSEESDLVDFTIMTLCDGGIVSNSSFSWWGAYFSKKELIIAPQYWFGFKSKIEIPVGVSPSFAKIISVD